MIPQWFPILAYVFLNLAVIPSIHRMWKRRSSQDVSLLWQGMVLTGVVIITIYALQVGDLVFITGGFLNIIGISSVLGTALYYRRGR
jgi:uncharacterized protein with PQ loop repeat